MKEVYVVVYDDLGYDSIPELLCTAESKKLALEIKQNVLAYNNEYKDFMETKLKYFDIEYEKQYPPKLKPAIPVGIALSDKNWYVKYNTDYFKYKADLAGYHRENYDWLWEHNTAQDEFIKNNFTAITHLPNDLLKLVTEYLFHDMKDENICCYPIKFYESL